MSLPTPVVSPAIPQVARPAQASSAEIDASCRNAVLFFFATAALWLAKGMLLALIASIKLHGPGMFASLPTLSYGRLQPAQSNMFLYGFASLASMGSALWLICRLGKTTLQLPSLALVGGLVWNVGASIGVLGILFGGNSGYDRFEMPRAAFPIMFVGYALFGLSALITFNARTERRLYVSMWFILAALFCFPWIFSTAGALLHYAHLRGSVVPVIGIWYANNLVALWLTPMALAVIYYFVPKLAGRPLYNGALAIFAFWVYFIFANATGFQHTAGLPRWFAHLSVVAATILIVPSIAMAINWWGTGAGSSRKGKGLATSTFVSLGALSFLAASAITFFVSQRPAAQLVSYTYFLSGLGQLVLYGSIGLPLLGAVYYIVPKLLSADWPKPAWIKAHTILTLGGVGITVVSLMLGGLAQGGSFASGAKFMTTLRGTLPFVGMSTLGFMLLAVGQILFFVHLIFSFAQCCANCCKSQGAKGGTGGISR